jgi:hypothetical protein
MKKILLIVLVFAGFQMMAEGPLVTARFYNPQYDCLTQTYCVDVEFKCAELNQQIFGVNVRFFYDDAILEFISAGDFIDGYGTPGFPDPINGAPGSGTAFGISDPAVWINGAVYLTDPTKIYKLESTYKRLFTLCFHVDDPGSLNIESFCPSLIWDLRVYPDDGGYSPSDGVVVTLVSPTGSIPSTENVEQFNWTYIPEGGPTYGFPTQTNCIPTICWTVPVSNWALFLGIGLMIVATVFIWRRRMNS